MIHNFQFFERLHAALQNDKLGSAGRYRGRGHIEFPTKVCFIGPQDKTNYRKSFCTRAPSPDTNSPKSDNGQSRVSPGECAPAFSPSLFKQKIKISWQKQAVVDIMLLYLRSSSQTL